jgi:hypothetical protein
MHRTLSDLCCWRSEAKLGRGQSRGLTHPQGKRTWLASVHAGADVHITVYILRCTYYGVHICRTYYGVHITVYILRCTYYVVHISVYILRCTYYVVHITVYLMWHKMCVCVLAGAAQCPAAGGGSATQRKGVPGAFFRMLLQSGGSCWLSMLL